MPNAFSRTLRAVEGERAGRRALWALIPAAALLVAWGLWMGLAEVGIWAVSSEARLEAKDGILALHAPVSSEVTRHALEVGETVEAGEVLVVLDREEESLSLAEAEAELASLDAEIESARTEIAAAESALAAARRRHRPVREELEAARASAEAKGELAEAEAERLEELADEGFASSAEAQRARTEAQQRSAEIEGLAAAMKSRESELAVEVEDRRKQLTRLRRELAKMQGQRAVAAASVARLESEVETRTIRAPRAGRIAEAAPLKPGMWVSEGERLATIMAEGEVTITAEFAPEDALGRIRPQATGRMLLDGFPWAQYGVVEATVERVAAAPREGRVRVELTVDRIPEGLVGLEHGLPGQVEVEVERIAPARLLLRLAGRPIRALRGAGAGAGRADPASREGEGR